MKVKVGLVLAAGRSGVASRWSRSWHRRTPGTSHPLVGAAYRERTRWDPKDGELCLVRTKPEETLVEVRFDSDVQIDRRSWV